MFRLKHNIYMCVEISYVIPLICMLLNFKVSVNCRAKFVHI